MALLGFFVFLWIFIGCGLFGSNGITLIELGIIWFILIIGFIIYIGIKSDDDYKK